MWTNASLTIRTRGVTYDQDTGHRTEGDEDVVIRDARCCYSQSRGTRQVFKNGLREYSKPVEAVLFETDQDIDIKPGYQATITPDGGTAKVYTVNHAILSVGIAGKNWQMEIESIDTP